MYETLLKSLYNYDFLTSSSPSLASLSTLEEFRFRFGIRQIYHDIV